MSVIGILLMMVGYGAAVYGFHEYYSFRQLSRLEQEVLELIDSSASSGSLI